LSRGGSEDDAQAILVVPWHRDVHHFDAAAGEAKGQWPEGAIASPGCDLVECCPAEESLLDRYGIKQRHWIRTRHIP
jgi:hypothetical protein